MKVYLIPGLGFDERIFRNLNIEKHESIYLNWIDPTKNESIQSYAKRLAEKIDSKESDVVLIGHSFGGVLCQEISVFTSVQKCILISSIKHRNENPFVFKIMSASRLYKLFSKNLTAKTIKYWGSRYDYKTEEEKELVVDMVNKQSDNYLQWALQQLSVWRAPEHSLGDKLIQIHGNLDNTLPFGLINNPNYIIKNGGHFMVYKKPNFVSEIINKEINTIK